MQSIEVNQVFNTWPQLAGIIYVPHTEEEYERLVTFLDSLVDEVGEDELHLLAPLLEIVGVLIESYEDQHVPELAE
jgi:HTH-type transcriptional regulator / antitoxin HigA